MLGVKSRILLIDDDKSFTDMTCKILSDKYDVSIAYSGEEGLDLLKDLMARNCQPNLILLDMVMPGLNGIETMNRIKAMKGCANIPVIMLTGMGELNCEVQGLQNGADDFIVKPFVKMRLFARIDRSLAASERYNFALQRSMEGKELPRFVPWEKKILRLARDGSSYKEISAITGDGVNTVRTTLYNCYKRLHIHKKKDLKNLNLDLDDEPLEEKGVTEQ